MGYDRFFGTARHDGETSGAAHPCVGLDRMENAGRDVTVWCAQDVLGMAQHGQVRAAMQEALAARGAGWRRDIAGAHACHAALERELAALHGKEAALLFNAQAMPGGTALGLIAAGMPGCIVLFDAACEGAVSGALRDSRAGRQSFRHNDPGDLARRLAALAPHLPKIIALPSIDAMDGSIAPLAAICDVADEYGAMIYLDERHAAGLYGAHGGGIAAWLGLAGRVGVIEGSLGTGFGVAGFYIAANAALCDFARAAIADFWSGCALPPAMAAGALAAIRHLGGSTVERARLADRVHFLRLALDAAGLPHLDNPSHIVPVMVGSAPLCRLLCDTLLQEHGHYLQPFGSPAVPRGTERLRIIVTPQHTDIDILHLVSALSLLWREMGQPLAA